MNPTRKVLLGIGGLVLLMIATVPLSWHLQRGALADALVADLEATAARSITRDPPLEAAKHENGFACYSAVIETTPADLAPFELKDPGVLSGLMDAGVVAEPWRTKVTNLEPWAESVRGCGNSERLGYVPSVTPFAPFSDVKAERGTQVLLSLTKMTRLQARILGADAKWEQIAELCAGTLEVALDRSHLGLVGAMIASSVVRQLSPPCGQALGHLGPESRDVWTRRFGSLPSRLISNTELIEIERQAMGLSAFGWLLSEAQSAKLPPHDSFASDDPLSRFAVARLWTRWDRSMRSLGAASKNGSSVRQAASLERDEVFQEWWIPSELSNRPDYERFFARMDDTALLLGLMSELASGGEVTLSPKLVRTASGLEFTDGQGEKVLIP
ncbi:MAG: hypothetical protein Q8N23_29480 [Archangium sp.]|nr:hypothetical protein [Archangium sp.]MDP3156838.1 hypothetical protein [Archangium sp.]MDP3569686.1 hypothetical protein [Archangium sp.]